MTHQIVTVRPAYLLRETVRVYVLDVDTAIDFAAWLQAQGFPVEMTEGLPEARTPSEETAANVLTEMYARARA